MSVVYTGALSKTVDFIWIFFLGSLFPSIDLYVYPYTSNILLFFSLNLLRSHKLIWLCGLQICNSRIHLLYIVLCFYYPMGSFLPSLFIPSLPFSTSFHSHPSLWQSSYCCLLFFSFFCLFFHLFLSVLYNTYELIHLILDFFCLILLNIISSRSIHIFTNGSSP